jgi:hypothetical protein
VNTKSDNTEENVEGQSMIPNADQNTENMTVTNGRFYEHGENVIFPKIGFCFHKSFAGRYKGMGYSQAKRKMKGWFTHREKADIVHYLKSKGIIKN